MRSIKKFNPYMMEESLITQLNTGRENDFNFVFNTIKKNIERKESIQHILLIGSRGIGKSFFLKYLGIKINETSLADYVLLPEEQLNIYNPSDLIREIKASLLNEKNEQGISNWASEDKTLWIQEAKKLEKVIAKRKKHVVIGIENFDQLFERGGAFEDKENQSLFRKYFTENKEITLVATTLCPDLDTRYDEPLFHFFAKHQLSSWKQEDHKSYFNKRSELEGIKDKKQLQFSEAKLKAITSFTGGSPRITVVMSDILIEDDKLESVTKDLETLIDDLTPFYQDLLSRIPPKSRMLFDALIRGGEPCTQSEIAERVKSKQNLISQSFNWLILNNYLDMELPENSKQKLYSVKDRLFANFYRMRYINHGSSKSILATMSEFLTSFYNENELKNKAIDFYNRGSVRYCYDLLQIINKDLDINFETFSTQKNLNIEELLKKNKQLEIDKGLKILRKDYKYSLKNNDFDLQILLIVDIYASLRVLEREKESSVFFEEESKRFSNSIKIEKKNFRLLFICLARFIMGEAYEAEAWKLIDENSEKIKNDKYKILSYCSNFIYYLEDKQMKAKAYAEGYKFLENIHKRKNIFNSSKALQIIFETNLYNKVSLSLIEDLYDASIEIFGEEVKQDLLGIKGIIDYLKSGKDQNVLIRMEPEVRAVVETLVKEWGL